MNQPDEIFIRGKKFRKFITKEEIEDIISVLAEKINKDYAGKELIFLVTMKGALFFSADLIRAVGLPCRIEVIRASSYGSGMKPGEVVETKAEGLNIEGKDVIILEDIIDTGRTMKKIIQDLETYKPASINVATLLAKPDMIEEELEITYLGKEIPPEFVVGYGLDYAEHGRYLENIYHNIPAEN